MTQCIDMYIQVWHSDFEVLDMKFSKGNLKVIQDTKEETLRFAIVDDNGAIAWTVNRSTVNDEANAHLFAAASELYDLLDKINAAFYTRTSRKEWLELMEQTKPLLQRARGKGV